MVTIHQFNPEIYPFKVWIVVTMNEDAIKERFNNGYNKELELNILTRNSRALTCQAVKKDTLDRGILTVFTNRKYMTVSTMAHESVHSASFMWDMMGETSLGEIGEEANAYLVGWIAGCCEEVKNYKHEKKTGEDTQV